MPGLMISFGGSPPSPTSSFKDFGLAEVVFTPLFIRSGFPNYKGFEIRDGLERVRRWRDAC